MSITHIGDRSNDGRHYSPTQALEDVIKEIKNGDHPNLKKILILTLNDENDGYRVGFSQTGMCMSECVALCNITQTLVKGEMGYYE